MIRYGNKRKLPETYHQSSAEAYEKAKEKGYAVRIPRSDELLLDLDTEENYQHFLKKAVWFLEGQLGFKNVKWVEFPSKDEGHRHIYVQFPGYEFTPLARIGFQALLGSDPAREMHSYVRIQCNDPVPTLLFEPPDRDTLSYRNKKYDLKEEDFLF